MQRPKTRVYIWYMFQMSQGPKVFGVPIYLKSSSQVK